MACYIHPELWAVIAEAVMTQVNSELVQAARMLVNVTDRE